MSEMLAAILRANLVAALAVAAVIVVRPLARHLAGSEAACRLWLIPPLAAIGSLISLRAEPDAPEVTPLGQAVDRWGDLPLCLWIAGAALLSVLFIAGQRRLQKAAQGPAVVGAFFPRIIMPADDGTYTSAERDLIREHERTHIVRGDTRAVAAATAFQALFWFNPMVHIAAFLLREDIELACDAAVIRKRPRDRALYARTLLKAQLAAQPLPFGCQWLSHPLEARVRLLARAASPSPLAAGAMILAVVASAPVASAWTAPALRASPPPAIEPERPQRPQMSVVLIDWPAERP